MNFAYEQPQLKQPKRRSQRLDRLATIQAALAGIILLFLCGLALDATWKVKFWRQTTGEVITSASMCRVANQWQWWIFTTTGPGTWVPCTHSAGSASGDGSQVKERVWRARVRYFDASETQQFTSIDLSFHQAKKLLDRTTVVAGDRLTLGHSNTWPSRADLMDSLYFWRMFWVALLLAGVILAAATFLLRIPAESQEEIDDNRNNPSNGWG